MVKGCLTCDVISGKVIPPGGVVYKNKYIAISHGIPPAQSKGFMIVAPIRHCEQIAKLESKEASALMEGIRLTSKALSKLLKPERVYVASFGETVKHIHFYVIPRYKGMPKKGPKVISDIMYKGRWHCSEEEAEVTAKAIKEILTT